MSLLKLNEQYLWTAKNLDEDRSWVVRFDSRAQAELCNAVRQAYRPGQSILDYTRDDFLIPFSLEVLNRALNEAKFGRGIALVKGLPREALSTEEFRLMTWALGLHAGTPRPQGKNTQYMSEVRNEGKDYRTNTGRGYSSNAELDFHTDSADLVYLSCYNKAVSGGMSLISSSMKAFQVIMAQSPDLARYLFKPIGFSRQGEAATGEGPFVVQPVFSETGGRWFGRWNWNRVRSAENMDGAPTITDEHRQALNLFDSVVRSPELSYSMWLEPGDLQILNSHVTLHSRTEFVDHDAPAEKRLLYRLWIAPPDSQELPQCWHDLYGSCEAGAVRGGIKGHCYEDAQRAFDARQAKSFGMRI